MDLNDYIKLHKAEDKPAEIAAIQKLYHEDRISQESNRKALLVQREKDGHVSVACGKCGTESVLDAKRPAKPAAKCGACGTELEGAPHPAPKG